MFTSGEARIARFSANRSSLVLVKVTVHNSRFFGRYRGRGEKGRLEFENVGLTVLLGQIDHNTRLCCVYALDNGFVFL